MILMLNSRKLFHYCRRVSTEKYSEKKNSNINYDAFSLCIIPQGLQELTNFRLSRLLIIGVSSLTGLLRLVDCDVVAVLIGSLYLHIQGFMQIVFMLSTCLSFWPSQ
jgi:hypothetical protein